LAIRSRPRAASAPRAKRDPPPQDTALPAAHQRKGGTPPPDDGARVGIRARLPVTPRTRPSPATLAQPLQHSAATQLTRRPTPNQPHSQRLWAGQLEDCLSPYLALVGLVSAMATRPGQE